MLLKTTNFMFGKTNDLFNVNKYLLLQKIVKINLFIDI